MKTYLYLHFPILRVHFLQIGRLEWFIRNKETEHITLSKAASTNNFLIAVSKSKEILYYNSSSNLDISVD